MESKSNGLLWLLFLGVILYLGYNFTPFQEPQSRILANRNTEVTVRADDRGHFVFTGEIDGKRVYFLYDTGATTIAIPAKIAKKLGLKKGQKYYSHTANGRAVSYLTRLREVKVGDIVMRNVQGSIATGLTGNQILLGMSFLNHVEITQYRGTLKLRVRN